MKRCLLQCEHFRQVSVNGLRNQTNVLKEINNTPNNGAIIVEKTHPDLELILARFDELAAFLISL